MSIEIRSFDSSFIEDQVNLIKEVTKDWKHEYQTSLESVTKAYNSENFDPSTRFYAIQEGKMMGYVTSAIVDDKDKGKYGTIRLPLVIGNDLEISTQLYNKAEQRLKELGATRIRSFAGEGMGNTLELAKKFGFQEGSLSFKRSRTNVENLRISGNSDGVVDYSDDHYDMLVDLFSNVIYPGGFGEEILKRMLANKKRKDDLGPHRTSWKLIIEDGIIQGFSALSISDSRPQQANMPPIYFRDISRGGEIIDKLLSSHVNSLKDYGLKEISTFIGKEIFAAEPLYNKFGFNYDPIPSYEKQL